MESAALHNHIVPERRRKKTEKKKELFKCFFVLVALVPALFSLNILPTRGRTMPKTISPWRKLHQSEKIRFKAAGKTDVGAYSLFRPSGAFSGKGAKRRVDSLTFGRGEN